ncbi:hypothetical protein H4R33_001938 [Dimargaris cristalligena]|nr:hypothetical protein H4R33_001938 [Dimargaris cristalligena]
MLDIDSQPQSSTRVERGSPTKPSHSVPLPQTPVTPTVVNEGPSSQGPAAAKTGSALGLNGFSHYMPRTTSVPAQNFSNATPEAAGISHSGLPTSNGPDSALFAAGLISPISPFHVSAHQHPSTFMGHAMSGANNAWGVFPFLQHDPATMLQAAAAAGQNTTKVDSQGSMGGYLTNDALTNSYLYNMSGVPFLSGAEATYFNNFMTPTKGTHLDYHHQHPTGLMVGSLEQVEGSLNTSVSVPPHLGLGLAAPGSAPASAKAARRTVSDGEAYWAGLALQGPTHYTPVRQRVVSYHGSTDGPPFQCNGGGVTASSLLMSAVPPRPLTSHPTPRKQKIPRKATPNRLTQTGPTPTDPTSPSCGAVLNRKRKYLPNDTSVRRTSTINPECLTNIVPLSTQIRQDGTKNGKPQALFRNMARSGLGVNTTSTCPKTGMGPACKRTKQDHAGELPPNLAKVNRSLEALEKQLPPSPSLDSTIPGQSEVDSVDPLSDDHSTSSPVRMTPEKSMGLDMGHSSTFATPNHPHSVPEESSAMRNLKHKVAEQKRRDAMKEAFERLKKIVPPYVLESEDGRDLARPVLLARAVDYMEQLTREVHSLRSFHGNTAPFMNNYPLMGVGTTDI